jgi:hypothetical protein
MQLIESILPLKYRYNSFLNLIIFLILTSLLFTGYFIAREYFKLKDVSYSYIISLLFGIFLSNLVYSFFEKSKQKPDTYNPNSFRMLSREIEEKYENLQCVIKKQIEDLKNNRENPKLLQEFEDKYVEIERKKIKEIEQLIMKTS